MRKNHLLTADILIILAHHTGEIDAFLPLIFLLRKKFPSWKTRLVVTKKSLMLQLNQSIALIEMMKELEIDFHFLPINAINEPAEFFSFDLVTKNKKKGLILRVVGRLFSYMVAAKSLPEFLKELNEVIFGMSIKDENEE